MDKEKNMNKVPQTPGYLGTEEEKAEEGWQMYAAGSLEQPQTNESEKTNQES